MFQSLSTLLFPPSLTVFIYEKLNILNRVNPISNVKKVLKQLTIKSIWQELGEKCNRMTTEEA